MQQKVLMSVNKCCMFLPSPIPSPHEERAKSRFTQSLPLGGDLEGQQKKRLKDVT